MYIYINQIYQSSWAHLPCKIMARSSLSTPNLQLSNSCHYVPLFRTAAVLVPGRPQSRCGRRGPPVKDHQGGVRWRVTQRWWWDIKKRWTYVKICIFNEWTQGWYFKVGKTQSWTWGNEIDMGLTKRLVVDFLISDGSWSVEMPWGPSKSTVPPWN